MLFNTLDFVVFFIFILTVVVLFKNKKFQHFLLLGASYFFFYFSSNHLLSLLIFSTVLDFYIAKAIWKTKDLRRKKMLLISSLAGNLGLLGFFKYADFAILQFNFLGHSMLSSPASSEASGDLDQKPEFSRTGDFGDDFGRNPTVT